uniref:GATOR complex protein NPRL3 n=2 Tax=Wuchereria bancrofti TaxID=6293 RepID=A0A1I8EP42_WUCBA
MDEDRYLYSPLGIMFVTMGENHEQVSFAYPFHNASTVTSELQSFSSSEPYPTICAQSLRGSEERNSSDAEQYGVPTKILSHLLSARGICEKPFEIKIDNIRFAGFPKTVSHPTGRSPQTFHVVFILTAKVTADLVTSFQELSRKIAIAIDEEQTRCDYLAEQMTIILNEHEKNESLPEGQAFPYHEVLAHCSLAQDLRDIFSDVSEHGVVHVFLNDCIEVGFCVEPRALLHAGLTPKTRSEIEATIRRLRPYHGILLLEDAIPGHDSNPALHFFLKHCHPDQSLISISDSSGLSLFQVLTVVRHLLLWARAIVIYPLCSSNVYTSATSPKPLSRLSEQFSEIFENAHLPTILAQFSPPCTLEEFTNASMHSFNEQQLRIRMVARLLRDELIMQLHTFLYLMPPFSHEIIDESNMDTNQDDHLNHLLSSVMLTTEVKASVIQVYKTMLKRHPQQYAEDLLDLFLKLVPYLRGEHHIEDIMYRMNLERSSIMRVLDTFACVIAPFMRPEYV